MVEHDVVSASLMDLEQLLVKQFRLLQQLVETSKVEREAMLGDGKTVMRLTEDKEVLLDQLNMVEEERRVVVQSMAEALRIPEKPCSVRTLISRLGREEAERLSRLMDGINILVSHARDLNQSNQALAHVKLDLIRSTQAFLISLTAPDVDYRPAIIAPAGREAPSWGKEYRV